MVEYSVWDRKNLVQIQALRQSISVGMVNKIRLGRVDLGLMSSSLILYTLGLLARECIRFQQANKNYLRGRDTPEYQTLVSPQKWQAFVTVPRKKVIK